MGQREGRESGVGGEEDLGDGPMRTKGEIRVEFNHVFRLNLLGVFGSFATINLFLLQRMVTLPVIIPRDNPVL
jgi:hypothetical protein